MRLKSALSSGCALLSCVLLMALCAPVAQAQTGQGPYNPATQAHWGACSLTTTNVAQAVGDLRANGVLAQYARLLGVQASTAQLRQALIVGYVTSAVTTANHGCTDTGQVFSVGPRQLYRGETVGVALPRALRTRACRGSHAGCERLVLHVGTVLPTNCWNIELGAVSVAVYVHRPAVKKKPPVKPKPPVKKKKPKPVTKPAIAVAKPSASAAVSCGAGGVVVTLRNAAVATASAPFTVNGRHYGPLAPGQRLRVTIALAAGARTTLTVSSAGHTLIGGRSISDTCPVPPTPKPPAPPTPQPTATAAMSCSAGSTGGVVVTLGNAASATADASFSVNGSDYGPVAPGASTTVTVPLASGATVTLTVTSGTQTLISGQSFTSTCVAAPAATAVIGCSGGSGEVGGGFNGGSVMVVLTNGADATLPASFTVSASGNTVAGFGPTVFGPVAPGGSLTEYIPVDASGNNVSVTVSSGGKTLISPVFTGGCPQPQLG